MATTVAPAGRLAAQVIDQLHGTAQAEIARLADERASLLDGTEVVALAYAEDTEALTDLIGTEGGEDWRGTVVADGYRAEAWPSVVYAFKGDEYRSDSCG